MIKKIELTQGKVSLVDEEDFEYLNQWKWYAQKDYKNGNYYAQRHDSQNNKKIVLMHKEILGVENKKQVDHKDGDGLNNQRTNLRPSSHSQNHSNTERYKNNKSGYKGVSWNKHSKKYLAQTSIDGKILVIGYFDSPEDAATAYNTVANQLHGDFTRPNIV